MPAGCTTGRVFITIAPCTCKLSAVKLDLARGVILDIVQNMQE